MRELSHNLNYLTLFMLAGLVHLSEFFEITFFANFQVLQVLAFNEERYLNYASHARCKFFYESVQRTTDLDWR